MMIERTDFPQETDSSFMERVAAEPALVQLLLVICTAGLIWLVLSRLSRQVREAEGRAAVKDYLLALEQTLAGDLKGACARLQRVLREDPENPHARYLYGLVLADMGNPAEAHKQHLQLQRGLGLESPRNDKALARNLLAVGKAADAVEPAKRAAKKLPEEVDAMRLLFRSQLAAGYPEEAASTGRQLARLVPPGAEQARILEGAGDAYARAAKVKLEAGMASEARSLISKAASASPGSWQLGRCQMQLALLDGGEASMWNDLRALDAGDGDYPATFLPALQSHSGGGSSHTLTKLVPKKPYRCEICIGELPAPMPICMHCGSPGQVVAVEPLLFQELDSPAQVMDAVEENRAHIRRLLAQVDAGESEAEEELVALGEPAVEETLTAAVGYAPGNSVYVGMLQRMGAQTIPALFAAFQARKSDWLARFGEILGHGSSVAVVGQVVQGYGKEALHHFEELLATDDRDLRKVIIDYFIGLGDPKEFLRVLERFPPVEVTHRLNETSATVLQAFLAKAEAGSFMVEVMLTDPGFCRDSDVLAAICKAQQPEVLEQILQRRGFNRSLTMSLIESLADRAVRDTAHRLLDSFGDRTIELQISVYADLDRSEEIRGELSFRIVAMGAGVVGKLCDCFGSTPTALDDQLVATLGKIGRVAVGPLSDAYQRGSLLEKFAGPLVGRHNHRRVMVIKALAAIGGGAALRSLEGIRRAETETNLKLRLAQALHGMADGDKSPEGTERDG